jgi:hypothetical protein
MAITPHSNLKPVFIGKSLSDNGVYNITDGFPIGPSYRRLFLDLHLALTKSSGTLASAIGDQHYLRSLSFSDDRGNIYVNALQGVPLWNRATQIARTAGRRTAIAASSATYSTLFCIDFTDPLTSFPDATIVDTQDCKAMTLSLSLGAIGDLLSVSGDTLSVTADCYVDVTKVPVAPGSVKFIQQLTGSPPVDPNAVTYVDIPKVQNEWLKRLHFLTSNSAGAYPFSGAPTANVLSKFNFQTQQELEYNQVLVALMNGVNKIDYAEETAITGWHTLDFIKGGALSEAIDTGAYTTLQLNWSVDTPSTSQLSCLQERIMVRK